MPKVTLTVGISCSGKTSWAEAQEDCVNLNRDDIRSEIIGSRVQWRTYKFKRENEKRVTELQKSRALAAIKYGKDVIISDTNLNPKTRQMWESFFKKSDYEVVIKEFPVALEEAWKRDTHRENGVGHQVIYRQYQQWLKYKGRRTYKPCPDLPHAVLVDIDGTVADMSGVRGPFEWDKADQDKPRHFILDTVDAYLTMGYQIIFLSGRDACCRELTELWLADQGFEKGSYELFMRPEGSYEKDTVVKERIFWEDVVDDYNVIAVLDDRPVIVRMWHEIGIPNVLCVANPFNEF